MTVDHIYIASRTVQSAVSRSLDGAVRALAAELGHDQAELWTRQVGSNRWIVMLSSPEDNMLDAVSHQVGTIDLTDLTEE